MIHGTSVTIVVISPNLKQSNWIDWEIEYSLKEITRADRISSTNGIVGVIMKYNGGYSWIVGENSYDCGCKPRTIKNSKLYKIISDNRYNLKENKYACERCKTVYKLSGSYISLIEEADFLKDPSKYIDNAYEKSQEIDAFNISKTR